MHESPALQNVGISEFNLLVCARYYSGAVPFGGARVVRGLPGYYGREEFEMGGGRPRRFSDLLGNEPPSGKKTPTRPMPCAHWTR
jgi:hypothetical protein